MGLQWGNQCFRPPTKGLVICVTAKDPHGLTKRMRILEETREGRQHIWGAVPMNECKRHFHNPDQGYWEYSGTCRNCRWVQTGTLARPPQIQAGLWFGQTRWDSVWSCWFLYQQPPKLSSLETIDGPQLTMAGLNDFWTSNFSTLWWCNKVIHIRKKSYAEFWILLFFQPIDMQYNNLLWSEAAERRWFYQIVGWHKGPKHI